MTKDLQSSGFFGFFDPDGRPWSFKGVNPRDYQRGLESALKIALLTQRHLVIPAGYFLDNPSLQWLFMNNSGTSREAKCFQALMRDLLRVSVSLNESNCSGPDDTLTTWEEVMNDWIQGTTTNRRRFVYLNSITPDAAESIQLSANIDQFKNRMSNAVHDQNEIFIRDYLHILNKLSLRTRTFKELSFPFDKLLRDRLLSGQDKFPEVNETIGEKLHAIAVAAQKSDVRISRSLISNKQLCLDIGVNNQNILSREEYKMLVPTLAYYHHYAFSSALGLESFVTYKLPALECASQLILREQLDKIANTIMKSSNSERLSWPLKNLTFENIYDARLGKESTKFNDSLQALRDSARGNDLGEYHTSLRKHARHVAKVVSLNFEGPTSKDLIRGLDETVLADEPTTEGALTLAKFSFTFFREFGPNIQKELQIRYFFQRLRKN